MKELNLKLEWKENLTQQEWDRYLISFKGHPLQSTKWGESRKSSYGFTDHRWIAFHNDSPVFIARFEERRFLKFFKVAWIPKGPLVLNTAHEAATYRSFFKKLKQKKFLLCITNPWKKIDFISSPTLFHTIWVDLTLPKETLWSNLHKQFRYDVKRAKKLGVMVTPAESKEDLQTFLQMHETMSKIKKFTIGNASQMMTHLFLNSDDTIETCLLLARYDNHICGGAFLIRAGENIHYLWGAMDRQFSHLSIGEALQWEIIEWGISKQCKKYDMEGISMTNSSVDKFKKKIGGTIITCPGIQIHSLFIENKFISQLMKLVLRWQ